jgi:hypothetical protein
MATTKPSTCKRKPVAPDTRILAIVVAGRLAKDQQSNASNHRVIAITTFSDQKKESQHELYSRVNTDSGVIFGRYVQRFSRRI